MSDKPKTKPDNSQVKFLPTLPKTRQKPEWQHTIFKGRNRNISSGAIEELSSISNDNQKMKNIDSEQQSSPINAKTKQSSIKRRNPTSTSKSSMKYPKKDREAFRKALVGIIMQNEDTSNPPQFPSVTDKYYSASNRAESPTVAEKDILRYYYYIHHGIDTKNVAPMEDRWIHNVLSLVPESTKVNLGEVIDTLSEEVREDYLLSVKKAIVDFVLRDPREKENSVSEEVLPHRLELQQVPKPWEDSFYAAYEAIQDKLFITNPTMAAVLNLWHKNYGKLKLVDAVDVKTKSDALELGVFQNLMMQYIESAKDTLLKKWFPEVQNIFHQGNKKKLIPGTHQTKRLQAFFNSAAILMGNQLQSLALNSLQEYSNILNSNPETSNFDHPGFIIRLILDGTVVKFEPDFNDFEVILLNVFDVIVKAVSVVPCIETKLYTEWSGQKKILKTKYHGEYR